MTVPGRARPAVPAGPAPPPAAPPAPVRAASRAATAVSVGAVGLGVAGEVLLPGGWGSLAPAVLVAGLLLGLPHGAVDHLVPLRRLGARPGRLAALTAGYAALAAVAYLAFRAAPGPALAAFVALSVWHFGSGETAFADLRAGRPVRLRVGAAAVLGAVALLLPLARPSADTAAVLRGLVPGDPEPLLLPAPAVVLAAAAGLVAVRLAQHRAGEAAEVALLVAAGLLVPPAVAFGLYFGAWHSVRHLARVLAEDPANAADLGAGRLGPPLCRFARAAALPTAVAAAALALLWTTSAGRPDPVATALPVLAALTVPHVLVVAWLDRVQGTAPAQPAGRSIGTCGMPSST